MDRGVKLDLSGILSADLLVQHLAHDVKCRDIVGAYISDFYQRTIKMRSVIFNGQLTALSYLYHAVVVGILKDDESAVLIQEFERIRAFILKYTDFEPDACAYLVSLARTFDMCIRFPIITKLSIDKRVSIYQSSTIRALNERWSHLSSTLQNLY